MGPRTSTRSAVDGPVSAAALLLSATVTDTVLRSDGDGAVRLQNAQGIVDRVLAIVEDADPTFPPLRQAPAM